MSITLISIGNAMKKVSNMGHDGTVTPDSLGDHAGRARFVRAIWTANCAAALAFVLTAGIASGGPVLNDPETWASAGGTAGWSNVPPVGTELAVLDTAANYLRITFNDQGGVPAVETDTIYTEDPDRVGNFGRRGRFPVALRFDFIAEDVLPDASILYVHSSHAGGATWEYAFANSGVGIAQHNIVFDFDLGGWSGPGGAADFWADMALVDRIGIEISRDWPNTAEQNYGLDDWEYYLVVPEPGTISILIAACISLTVAFRGRMRTLA